MRKAIDNTDVIVGEMYAFSPEQLELIAVRMRDAIKKRTDPGQKVWIQAATGLWFYHDPNISRKDIERGSFSVSSLEGKQSPNGFKPTQDESAILHAESTN